MCSVLLGGVKGHDPQVPDLNATAGTAALPLPPSVSKKVPLRQPVRQVPTGVFAIRGVRLFDGEGVIENATVVVRGATIEAVGTDVAIPEGASVVEGQGKTLLPGLIDAHTHAFTEENLEQAVVVGVTTELVMGGAPDFAKRMKEEAWGAPRADVFSAGHGLTVRGGYGTQFGGDVPTVAAGGDGAGFANARMDEGSDFVKIFCDHRMPSVGYEQVRSATQAAGARGRLAVAHAGSAEEASMAVHAGVDGLAHLWWIQKGQVTPQTLELMAERGTFVIPTLEVLYSLCGQSRGEVIIADPLLGPYIAAPALETLKQKFVTSVPECQRLRDNVRLLNERGITILTGTDAAMKGVAHGVSLHDELVLLQEAGLTALEVLAAATSNAADAFHMPDRGRVAPGMLADLVLVAGDPTSDVREARNITGVWKHGWPVARAAWAEKVARQRVASAQAAPGAISSFETGVVDSLFGAGFAAISDREEGGKSRVAIQLGHGGALGSAHSLCVTGEVVRGRPATYAGVSFFPGQWRGAAADLSRYAELVFFAKGEAQTYVLSLLGKSGGWRKPSAKLFTPDSKWQEYRFKLSDFPGVSCKELIGVFWGSFTPGTFALQLDKIRLE